MSSPTFTIRPSTPDDIPDILRLIKDLAIFEKSPESARATPDLLLKNLFPSSHPDATHAPYAYCLVATTIPATAEEEPQVIALALYFFNFSTWTGKPGLYLEDLYVKPEQRGTGVGKALFRELGRIALAKDCARVDWSVLDWNTPAQNFYSHAIKAKIMPEWWSVRLEGEDEIKLLETLQ